MCRKSTRALLFLLLCWCGEANAIEIPQRFLNVGEAHGVPAGLLLAIALTESRWHKKKEVGPWPWTLNIAGSGRFYETKEDMLDDLSVALFEGKRSIDIGEMQLNLVWQNHRFEKITDMANPLDNLNIAAIILLENRKRCGGDWWCAVGAYHSSNSERARKYVARVKKWLEKIT